MNNQINSLSEKEKELRAREKALDAREKELEKMDERILELLRDKQELFDTFAGESTAGSEYMKAEQSIGAAIIQMEKERLAEELAPTEHEKSGG